MTLHIEMVSDLVCPWCWVGLRRLKGAMALVPDLDVEVLFRPFELDPTIPAGGTDYKAYMKARFGSDQSRDRANQMQQRAPDKNADRHRIRDRVDPRMPCGRQV